MRILHISNHRAAYNGMVTAAIDLACAQADLGHDVAFCSGPGNFDDLLAQHNIKIFDLGSVVRAKSLIDSALSIDKVIKEFRPDVVHTHMIKASLLAWPITRLRKVALVTCVQNSFSRYAPLMRVG